MSKERIATATKAAKLYGIYKTPFGAYCVAEINDDYLLLMRVSKESQFASLYDVILAEDDEAQEAFVLHALLTVKVPKNFLDSDEYEPADIELPQDFVEESLAAAAYAEEKKLPRIAYPTGRSTGPDEDLRADQDAFHRRHHRAFKKMVEKVIENFNQHQKPK